MVEIGLTSIAVVMLLTLSVHALAKQRAAAGVLLAIVLWQLAGIEAADRLSLLPNTDFVTFRTVSVYLEALMAITVLLLSVIYGRKKPFASMSKLRLALIGVSAFAPIACTSGVIALASVVNTRGSSGR